MDITVLRLIFFFVLTDFTLCGEYCNDGYEVFYCTYGCCGRYYDEFCCGMYTWAIGVIVMGAIIVVGISVCGVCIFCKKKNKNCVVQVPQPISNAVHFKEPSISAMYQPQNVVRQQQRQQQQLPVSICPLREIGSRDYTIIRTGSRK